MSDRIAVFFSAGVLLIASCSLSLPGEYEFSGDRYALVIGIKYEHLLPDEPFEPLYYPPKDAGDMRDLFISLGIAPDNIEVLSGRVAKSMILEKIAALNVGAPDQVIIYAAGHGYFDDAGHYLVTEEDDGSAGYLSAETFIESIGVLDSQVFVFLDMCYSGGFIQENPHSHDSVYSVQNSEYPRSDSLKAALQGFFHPPVPVLERTWVMSAAGRHEESLEPDTVTPVKDRHGRDIENGLFTHYLLHALQREEDLFISDIDRDGMLRFSELYKFLLDDFRLGDYGYLPHVTGTPFDGFLF